MKLLVLTEDFHPNTSGGAHARTRFSEIAAEEGHDVTVITPRLEGTQKRESMDRVEIHRPYHSDHQSIIWRMRYFVLSFYYTIRYLISNDIDGIYSISHFIHPQAKILSIIFDLDLVNFIGYTPSLHDNQPLVPRLVEWLNFKYFMGDIVFCRTNSIKKHIKEVSGKDVRVLHGVVNEKIITEVTGSEMENELRDSLNISQDEVMICFVGRLAPVKNSQTLPDILSELPEKYNLVVAGDGPEREMLENRISDGDLADRIHVLGRVPHEKAIKLIWESDALVLPSEVEAYPTVVFEGLILGCEVFATPVGALPSLEDSRLHLAELDDMPDKISQISPKRGTVSTSRKRQYGMERYARETVNAFVEVHKNGNTSDN